MSHISNPEPGSKGSLNLEIFILPEDKAMETLSPAQKEELGRGSATTFTVWTSELDWYEPSPREALFTMPGLQVNNAANPCYPSDPMLKWSLHQPRVCRQEGHL